VDSLVFVNLKKSVGLQVGLLIQYTVVVRDHSRELSDWRGRLTLDVESGLRLPSQHDAILVSVVDYQIGVAG